MRLQPPPRRAPRPRRLCCRSCGRRSPSPNRSTRSGSPPTPTHRPGRCPSHPSRRSPAFPELPWIPEIPIFPKLEFCNLGFLDGCYSLSIRRTGSLWSQVGTIRVDRGAPDAGPDGLIVSGDVYNDPPPWFGKLVTTLSESVVHFARPVPPDASDAADADPPASAAARASLIGGVLFPWRPRIPIFPRHRYHSYLKGTRLSAPIFTFGHGKCQVTLDFEQFDYTHPPAGSHQGSFPSSPSRNIRFVLDKVPSLLPTWWWGGPTFQGRLYEGGVDKGPVTLAWVSSFFRRATLEIDTLTGAVPPLPCPHPAGTGTEFFDTIYAKHGWKLTVVARPDEHPRARRGHPERLLDLRQPARPDGHAATPPPTWIRSGAST